MFLPKDEHFIAYIFMKNFVEINCTYVKNVAQTLLLKLNT